MNRDPLIGQRLANYQIESVLGRGGMAVVYFARDVSLERSVAVKVIDTQFRQNVSFAQRFISEARAVASWRHENIVQVFYADQEDELYYFVMKYIDGLDLETLLRQYADDGELMPQGDVVRIGKAVASALDYAHKQGVIHRDVKPSNVMIASDDRVVLMDFGLALDTHQGSMGEVFGTPHYVSPEQARRSADAVPQSDVYSLGVMLYEMLTGIVPFDDPSAASLALQHLTIPPPPPRSLNPALNQATEDVLLKALAKQADERYPTAAELMKYLEEALKAPQDKLATAELPPLPPGVEAPRRSLSSQTVTERIAVHVQSTHTYPMPQPPRIKQTDNQKEKNAARQSQAHVSKVQSRSKAAKASDPDNKTRNMFLPITLAVILAVVVIGGIALFLGGFFNQEVGALPTEVVLNTDVAQAVGENATDEVIVPPEASDTLATTETDIPATATPVPSDTAIMPTDTAMPSATPVPTNTPITPTVTPIPSNTPVVPTMTPVPLEPTVLYPNGRIIQFIWDDNSFYWYNPTGESIPVSPIVFEALVASGISAGYIMDGSLWTMGFRSVESGKCDAIEIIQSPALRPAQCRGYNAFVTPQRSNEMVFWITRDNVPEFRVLWDGEEVGRCEIKQGFCELRIP